MKHCQIHRGRPRPDVCDDCRRIHGTAPLELTDTMCGQLTIDHTFLGSEKIIVRPTRPTK